MKFWQSYQTNRVNIFLVISVFKAGSYGAGFFYCHLFFVLIKGYKRLELTFMDIKDHEVLNCALQITTLDR